MRTSLLERFEGRIEKVPEAGCWLWTGALFADGRYGQIKAGERTLSTHRVSWTLYKGEIPEGTCVLHRCDTPSCVNPDHLFLGTVHENNSDRARKGRTHRPHGILQGAAKLDDEKVAFLRSLPILRLARATQLAAEWGVHHRHLYRIRRGERWANR